MPFIGFLGPTWEVIGLTRILHRQSVYYHSIYEYSSIFCIFPLNSLQIILPGENIHRAYGFLSKVILYNVAVGDDNGDILQFLTGEEAQVLGFLADTQFLPLRQL